MTGLLLGRNARTLYYVSDRLDAKCEQPASSLDMGMHKSLEIDMQK